MKFSLKRRFYYLLGCFFLLSSALGAIELRPHVSVFVIRSVWALALVSVLAMVWVGRKLFAPIHMLTELARKISHDGIRREHKRDLLKLSTHPGDEVGLLAAEFKRMATTLLEREKTVEAQTQRLQEQNRLLREMAPLQERLRQSEHLAALGRLSAQVAHEVRNPLHSIGLEAELALSVAQSIENHKIQEALQSILTSVDRLDVITENYLKWSRLSTGLRTRVSLGDLVERVIASYAAWIQSKNIVWEIRGLAQDDYMVNVDEGLLETVIGNLLKNAVQSGATKIYFEVERIADTPEKIQLTVGDNGSGLPKEVRERLYEPFVTTKSSGTGLGLSFVKRVLDEHSAEIEYRPGFSEGSGTRFILRFLAAKERSSFDETALSG